MPALSERPQIDAEFEAVLAENANARRIVNAFGPTGKALCAECFALGYLGGQADALRYHTEMMAQSRAPQTSAPAEGRRE